MKMQSRLLEEEKMQSRTLEEKKRVGVTFHVPYIPTQLLFQCRPQDQSDQMIDEAPKPKLCSFDFGYIQGNVKLLPSLGCGWARCNCI